MADFDFTNPTPGGSSGTWGAELNAILDILKAHPGIRVVADATALAAYVPLLGQVILQADTATLYKCTNATGPVWTEVSPAAIADSVLTTKGDLLVYGSGLVRLPVGSNGQVLTADSEEALGIKWSNASGGSGGTPKNRIYVPYGTASPYDDEFDDGEIDQDWVAVDVPSFENSWYESTGIKGLSVHVPNNAGSMRVRGLLKPFVDLTPPFYIETAVSLLSRSFNHPAAGLWFADGTAYGSGVQLGGYFNMSSCYISMQRYTGFNARTNFNEYSLHSGMVLSHLYLRFVYESANTFRLLYSLDGVVWTDGFGSASYSLTPTHFGVSVTTHDSSEYPMMAKFHYFRVRSGSSANG